MMAENESGAERGVERTATEPQTVIRELLLLIPVPP